ncbi:L,D-transpeptidase [Ferviditalea candida]|uniref:L,D-transpeptidase n=1 Tax=Ferviditalea candida TaxID=3108399 RepID=A0ABU5ZCI1_9BACL|nr:L,D-transpeptidase [Paenibacillaceae bacterium T2]
MTALESNEKIEFKDEKYLKDYVKLHPDNKMVWYLLGREYVRKGETGKATYCFQQAGEVYLAFEDSAAGAVHDQEAPGKRTAGSGDGPNERRKTRKPLFSVARYTTAAIWALLLIFFIPALEGARPETHRAEVADPALSGPSANPESSEVRPSASPLPSPSLASGTRQTPEKPMLSRVYYLGGEAGKGSYQAALFGLAESGGSDGRQQVSLVAESVRSSVASWTDWTREPKLRFTAVSATGGGGALQIRRLEPEQCSCLSPGLEASARLFAEWRNQQEQLWVLASAVRAYQAIHHQLPDTVKELQRNYPGNLLPGYTPIMKQGFAFLFGKPASGIGAETAKGQSASPLKAAEAWERALAAGLGETGKGDEGKRAAEDQSVIVPDADLLQSPLEIIVDRKHHRLALVSGSIILRNYPVGLGGSRTPLGEFVISEKVMNPNGHADGDYGSRGMTLSDTLYAIHGTNAPESIGKDLSHGCIRMLKDDIEELYDMAPIGTKVSIRAAGLPEEIMRSSARFALPHTAVETNPHHVYKWLN